jgi:ribose 5-phosphate isomerase A
MTALSAEDREAQKRAAAEHAVVEVEDGMVLGLGSGSTAELAIAALGKRVAAGLRVAGIPTSERSAALARRLGVPLASFAEHRRIDLTIDGADQVERGTLALVKGLGGALLREKVVASASRRMTVVVDETKLVERLGDHTPLPVEIVPFGWEVVMDRLVALDGRPELRRRGGEAFITENGNYIADCRFAAITDPAWLEARLAAIVGVVESGLFLGLASKIIVGSRNGVAVIEP